MLDVWSRIDSVSPHLQLGPHGGNHVPYYHHTPERSVGHRDRSYRCSYLPEQPP